MDSLLKIIAMFDGNKSALSSKLQKLRIGSKISQAHINNWLKRDKKVPGDWVIPLCKVVDWKITPHEVRVDLYPNPDDGLPVDMRHSNTRIDSNFNKAA